MDGSTLTNRYDVEAVRRDFPILSRQVYGKPLVYLDSGASAQKPQAVIDAVSNAYANEYANVHRGLHFLSNAATDAYEAAREKVRSFLNAGSGDEIVFTRNTTEAINTVAYGWGMPNIGEGDDICLTIMEHHSNIVPWHFIRERQGARLNWVPVADDGSFSIEDFERTLTPRTKLVAITHMSNVLGTIVPVKEVCRIAHERGIPVLVDGSQGAVHLPVDVRDIGCDWYVFTGHKVYGPSGIGVLYGRKEMLDAMRPFQGGGEMIQDVSLDEVTYADPPHRFEAGTPPIVQAIGLGAALDYMQAVGREAIAAHEAALVEYAHERLAGVEVHADLRHRARQGRHRLFRDRGHPRPRRVDGDRPVGRGRARRNPLRQPALETLRRDLYLQGVLRHVQHARRSGRSGRSARQGANVLFVKESNTMTEEARTEQEESVIPRDELARLTDDIVSALKTVYDPEIPADIYELGLIYKIDIEDDRSVRIDMTLTAPGCPVAGEMPGWVQNAVSAVEGVSDVDVNMVFDPPWTPDRMSEEAQVAIGWY